MKKVKRHIRLPKMLCISIILLMGVLFLTISGVSAVEKPTLTHWNWRNTEIPVEISELYRRFEERYWVNLECEDLNWADVGMKYVIAGEAGELPETFEMWAPGQLAQFAERGWILPLDEYIAREEGLLDNFYEWAAMEYKGKIYGLSSVGLGNIMFWNKAAFAEAGLPGPPTTWDELVDYAVKLNDPPRQYGLGLNGGGDVEVFLSIAHFIYENGSRVGRVKGKMYINSPETVEAIQFVVDLVTKHKVVPGFATSGVQQIIEDFCTGKVAMYIDWAGATSKFALRDPQFDWEAALLPVRKTTGSLISGGDLVYVMSNSCKNEEQKELAWEFIRHMTSFESSLFFMEPYAFLPTRKDVAAELDPDEHTRALQMEQASLPNAYSTYDELPPQLMTAIDFFIIELQSAATGRKTVQKAMDTVAEEWTALFDQWEKRYGKLDRLYD